MIFMKKIMILFGALCAIVLAGCASTPSVSRVSSDTVTDLSGYWNDTDVKTVTQTLTEECLSSAAISNYYKKYKKNPVVIVGTFENRSSEHLDTAIITKRFEIALVNSGRVDFVASSDQRGEIREERKDQQVNASEKTQSALLNETGADFMLVGSVKTIVDSNGKQTARTYYVSAELIDIETNQKLWMGEDSSIKKLIKNASYR